jgi:hypothetical protein
MANLKGCGVWPVSGYYTSICMIIPRKLVKYLSQDSYSLSQDVNYLSEVQVKYMGGCDFALLYTHSIYCIEPQMCSPPKPFTHA